MSNKLTLLDDASDSEVELSINKSYASKYNDWRNKEELQKYKDLKKNEEDSESSSESEEEIPEFDEEFLRALSLLKGKDPRLYDKNFQLFKNKETVKKTKTVKQKPIYMKDYERNLVLERGGKFSDEDEDDNVCETVPTYNEELEKIKKSIIEAHRYSDNSDSDDEDLLKGRINTEKEKEEEETAYVKWLKGEEKEVSDDVKKDMSYLRNYWNDPKLDEGEKFLKDYILNKRYLEKDDSDIPTYEEITSGMLSEDEEIIEEQEKFEHKYNFRFEEPDEEFIKRYPRTVGDTLRRVDNRRKQKREEKSERKKKEKEQRKEELKRLKALKRKEIEDKFMKLKEISGQDEINLNESDIESDFDPDKHDQKMKELFSEEYYQVEEDQKPEFPFDEELDSENWNAWAGEKIVEEGEEKSDSAVEDDENVKCNQGESSANFKDKFADEMIDASRPKKKVKKKSLFAKIISAPKPVYDPDGKSFEEYLDEYYKLDYEDFVGDMPVRYKYRQVIPNDFGLTVDEILAADDRELNRWCSVKKTCQYRNDEEELYEVQAFKKKAVIPNIKQKFLPSVYTPKDLDNSIKTDEDSAKNVKWDSRNNNLNETVKEDNLRNEDECSPSHVDPVKHENSVEASGLKNKNKKRKRKRNSSSVSNGVENPNPAQNVDDDIDKSKSESSLIKDEENTVDCNEQLHKSMKKKHKGRQNSSSFAESESDVNTSASCNKSAMSVHMNSSRKRKRADKDTQLAVEASAHSGESDDSFQNLKKQTPDSGNLINSHDSLIPLNSEELPKKKKKKKKKKKNQSDGNTTNAPSNSSNSFNFNKSKEKHKKFASDDKRLALSNERLAAYGINPKKFKNKIIYSKK